MAGSLAIVATEQPDNAVAPAAREEWQVQFARYFDCPFPSLSSSTCSSLIPLPDNRRYRPARGTWISTSSQNASLHVVNNGHSVADAILSVCFRGKILEEHYITKLHFSWPQVSCISGFPARGSRVVLVSYKDSANEIQKFALRFSTLHEVEIFINSLKELLEDTTPIKPVNSDFKSEISSQSEFMSSNMPLSRDHKEEPNTMTPVYAPQMPPSLNYDIEQHSCSQKMTPNHNIEGFSPGMPPSFMSLLANCVSGAKEAAAQPPGFGEVDLKSQIVRCMEDSAFQEMLIKVEKVISEIGEDLSLKCP